MSDTEFPDCNTAALHEIGHIQPLGTLIAVNARSDEIDYCSTNTAATLRREPAQVLGCRAEDLFGAAWQRIAGLAASDSGCRLGEWASAVPHTVIAHHSGSHRILELEPTLFPSQSTWEERGRFEFLRHIADAETQADLWQLLTDTVMDATGYDRVMVYRFLRDWDGEVVYERCRDGVQGFSGLRFPGSDIPENARRLYRRNWQRIIADVDADNAPIVSSDPAAGPLDLTHSFLRAVHPAHIQYLRNMGLRSSFSLSLIVDGELWGMVTCHHHRPMVLSARQRLVLEEVARLTCMNLRHIVHRQRAVHQSALHERLIVLDEELDAAQGGVSGNLADHLGRIGEILAADSIWLRVGDEEHRLGEFPDADACAALLDWIGQWPNDRIGYYENLPVPLRTHASLEKLASGMLYLPLSGHGSLIALRREVVAQVHWAGDRGCEPADGDLHLSPRRSFEAWTENVRYQSEQWDSERLVIAEALRNQLIEHLTAVEEKELAYREPLTGLANRYALETGLRQAITRTRKLGCQVALHVIDLDHFKPINDALGHAAGDEVLKTVADRLRGIARDHDLVARLGGDEFAVVQRDIESDDEAALLAKRIVRALMRPIDLPGETVRVGASVGFALGPKHAQTLHALLHTADKAMYAAKASGRGCFAGAPSATLRNPETLPSQKAQLAG